MTAAFWLTNQPDWQQQYRIDVYQMGWRLGGKGASGRNAGMAERIEEHGLHIWFGFYDNAFDVMKQTYAELGRAPGSALATWDEAFKPQHYVCLSERIEEAWRIWPVETPPRSGSPGSGQPRPGPGMILPEMLKRLDGWVQVWAGEYHACAGHAARVQGAAAVDKATTQSATDLNDPVAIVRACRKLTGARLMQAGAMTGAAVDADVLDLLKRLQSVVHDLAAALGDPAAWPDELRRVYLLVDLALAMAIGMLADDVFGKGFEAINDIEFRAWLTSHDAQPISVDSAPVRGFYDLVFAYRDGDFEQPDIEAGTMLRGMLKVALCYHGAIMYKMQAGMGDVVFMPLYELLTRRGVRFHFFSKVLQLEPDAGGDHVASIRIQHQVSVSDGEYAPQVEVRGLPCWPARPLYSQLEPEQAALLREHQVNLESHWSNWPELHRQHFGRALPTTTLRHGEDFDQVVFGLSVASLAEVAPMLLRASPALQRCSKAVQTVATQAYQVWMHPDLDGLGWQYPASDGEEPVLSGFTEPFDTWAPMDQLLCRENWPADMEPHNVSYFCNAFPVSAYLPQTDHGFPAACTARVKASAVAHLQNDISALWTRAPAGDFPWQWLLDPARRDGQARFDAQFWRANIDPSERYVMSVTGSSRFRLRADQSGFDNLYLVGDWLKTGLDAGCVEAAVMGGMQASRAICSWPKTIHGENGW